MRIEFKYNFPSQGDIGNSRRWCRDVASVEKDIVANERWLIVSRFFSLLSEWHLKTFQANDPNAWNTFFSFPYDQETAYTGFSTNTLLSREFRLHECASSLSSFAREELVPRSSQRFLSSTFRSYFEDKRVATSLTSFVFEFQAADKSGTRVRTAESRWSSKMSKKRR